MNIFLDFEATNYGNHLISIGAIAEDGRSFYSVVNPGPKNRRKITPFITELTGITKEMCKEAPTYEEIFESFFDWCFALGDPNLHFFCYGDCDELYIKDANDKVTDNIKAEFITRYILQNITDYSDNVKKHLELVCRAKLIKVASFYEQKELTQQHNALEDAKLLKFVYEKAENGLESDSIEFKEFLEQNKEQKEGR